MRIEIGGSLSTGKTTLAKLIAERGFEYVSENFEDNPYLPLVSQDPEKYGYDCQKWFVDNKIETLGALSARDIVTDYSPYTDRAYIAHYMSANPEAVQSLCDRLDAGIATIGKPAALIYLTCDEDEQLGRIKSRGRDFEQGLDLDFLRSINSLGEQYLQQARAAGVPVIEIDTGRVDMRKPEVLDRLVNQILSASPAPQPSPGAGL
jgi:deoxyadenosine/deoxycytidine kinase